MAKLHDGFCKTLRELLDKMSDEEFERETKDKAAMLASIGYKRKEKE